MIRGYSTSRDVVPNFLQAFDVDDGRAPCPLRTRTVTAPQALFLMNSDVIDGATAKFAERLKKESGGDSAPRSTSATGSPSPAPRRRRNGTSPWPTSATIRPGLKGFAWLLFNLDEFIYVR